MKLHVINAAEGDCLLLESSDATPQFILIDGGPAGTYDGHARSYLRERLGSDLALKLLVVSHVDADHITGVLDLLADIEADRANGQKAYSVQDLWHNSFSLALDTPEGEIAQGIQSILDVAGLTQQPMNLGQVVFYGIAQGARLARSAKLVGIPLNHAFSGELISPDSVVDAVRQFGDLTLQVIGPSDANLRELQREWLAWLRAKGETLAVEGVAALANIDKSIPNLSSIVLIARSGGKSILLTGDARGDHILQCLETYGEMDEKGVAHFSVLKLQHHGSDRNADLNFFRRITADRYVISANGKHGNPDLETLLWIVDAADGRAIEIIVTNATPSLDLLTAKRPPDKHGYTLTVGATPATILSI